MDRAVQHIVELIEHLRQESLREQTRCFYCGGRHRSVDCGSAKREDFHRVLFDITVEFEEMEEDQGPGRSGMMLEVRTAASETHSE